MAKTDKAKSAADMRDTGVCSCDAIHDDVVKSVSLGMPPKTDSDKLAELFRLFADGTRVRIMQALALHELCVCDIGAVLGMSKSAISHSLKLLRMANLVTTRRDGQVVFYSLSDEHVGEILAVGLEHSSELGGEVR
ncbi:transcriptional regulator [Clostridia bacterium]|nr:transcriptional regulator [Clostridia bacterium]GHU57528.1 transcriptional regulator [Clostridia bacterium]